MASISSHAISSEAISGGSGNKSSTQVTELTVLGLPGQLRSFTAKAAAATNPRDDTRFTELSVLALPGQRHSFIAKGAAPPAGPHTGLFTELSVMSLPGQRHTFIAKTGTIRVKHRGFTQNVGKMMK